MDKKRNMVIDENIQNKKQKTNLNKYDPIMLNKLGKHVFKFVRPNGLIIGYNIKSLVKYFLTSGNFSEPETKIEFSDNDLKRLDQEAIQAKMKLDSTFLAKQNKSYYKEQKIKEDMLLSLERCASDYITEMITLIERHNDIENAQMYLLLNIFPSFDNLFIQLKNIDMDYSYKCMDNFILYLHGPKNKRTSNRNNLLYIIITHLISIQNGEL